MCTRPVLTAQSFLCCRWTSLVLEYLTQIPWLQEVLQKVLQEVLQPSLLCPTLSDCVPFSQITLGLVGFHQIREVL